MKGGDIILTPLPPFGDLLVCGISTQLRQAVGNFDEVVAPTDPDFAGSGLVATSLIRLGFVTTVAQNAIKGRIGSIAAERHRRLAVRLAAHLSSTVA